jgi:glycosyltransferase involved in cell wall biosynthesis
MLGAGFAGCFYRSFRRDPPALVHAMWAGAPATAGWLLWRILGLPYSTGAHAYDLYEHGGDWWLMEKIAHARFVHASTAAARSLLLERGADPAKIQVIRRGLAEFPPLKPLRRSRQPLRLACIARLVAKKGLLFQLRIYAELHAAGVDFEARIMGEGPLRSEVESAIHRLGLSGNVSLLGQRPTGEAWRLLDWADALLHTGVIAPSGDRDGLPNVIPEAMAAGTIVVTSPVSATTEAISDGVTGLVAEVDRPAEWVAALRRVATDDALAEQLRSAARGWVERNYDARRNTADLAAAFIRAITGV